MLGGANINKAALPSTLIGMLLGVGTVVTLILFLLIWSIVPPKRSPCWFGVIDCKPKDCVTRSNPCFPNGLPKNSPSIGDVNCKPYPNALSRGLFCFDKKAPTWFNNKNVPTRTEVMEKLIPYIQEETSKGVQLNHIMRHTVGLFHGQNGSRTWKQYLSKNMCIRDADLQKVNHIMDQVRKTYPVSLER